jgi:hypothetical protein
VAFVQRKFGFSLPYSPESLIVVDAIVDKIRATGAVEEQVLAVLSGLGCYAGEVFVRHARASWRWPTELGLRDCRSPAVLALPGKDTLDPIGSVLRRFHDEGSSSLARLFETAARRDGPGSS